MVARDAGIGDKAAGLGQIAAVGTGDRKMQILALQPAHGSRQHVEALLEIDPPEEEQDLAVADLAMAGAEAALGGQPRIFRRIEPVGNHHPRRAMDIGLREPHLVFGRVMDGRGPGEQAVLEPMVEQHLLQAPALEDIGIERAMGPQQIGLAVAPGEIAHHPVMEQIERMQMDHVEAGDIGFQRPAQRPGGEPDLGMLQGEEADPHAIADAVARHLGRLAEIGRIDRHLMAAPRHGARHFEACLGRPPAFGRQIADDVENAQRSIPRCGLNAPGPARVPAPAQPIGDGPRCRQPAGGCYGRPSGYPPSRCRGATAFP